MNFRCFGCDTNQSSIRLEVTVRWFCAGSRARFTLYCFTWENEKEREGKAIGE